MRLYLTFFAKVWQESIHITAPGEDRTQQRQNTDRSMKHACSHTHTHTHKRCINFPLNTSQETVACKYARIQS